MLLNRYFIQSFRTAPLYSLGKNITANHIGNNVAINSDHIYFLKSHTFATGRHKHGEIGPHHTVMKYEGVSLNTLQDNRGAKKKRNEKDVAQVLV